MKFSYIATVFWLSTAAVETSAFLVPSNQNKIIVAAPPSARTSSLGQVQRFLARNVSAAAVEQDISSSQNQQYEYDSDGEEEDGDDDITFGVSSMGSFDLKEYTNIILDEENYPVGSLPEKVVRACFDILFQHRRLETIESAELVEAILNRMEREDVNLVRLNTAHYTIAISAWADSGHPFAGRKGDKIFQHMQGLAKTGVNPLAAPDRVTYSTLQKAYINQGDVDKAHEILKALEDNPKQIMPTATDYSTLMAAFARVGRGREAEELLKRMLDLYNERGAHIYAPSLTNYNMVLDAWAKCHNEPGAVQRSLDILNAMHDLVDQQGYVSLHPDERSYTAVITALGRDGNIDNVQTARDVFEQALSKGIRPDPYMYTALMMVYSNVKDAENTELLLEQMECDGIENSIAYNIVLRAWKSSSNQDAPERAERILERMIERGVADTISFTTVICTFGNRGDEKSAVASEALLQRMQDLNLEGKVKMKPNVLTYNSGMYFFFFLLRLRARSRKSAHVMALSHTAPFPTTTTVMQSWVRCGNALRADVLLNRMHQNYLDGASDVGPNVVSYSIVLNG